MNIKHQRITKTIVAACAFCALTILINGCDLGSSQLSDMTISPSSVLLDASKVSVTEFTASGGDSNYTWSLEYETLGTLYSAGITALYQNNTNIGTNYLIVEDSSSNYAYATIVQR